jgi:hypothetical protein
LFFSLSKSPSPSCVSSSSIYKGGKGR